MKRKNNDAKDAAEYGIMVFRQDEDITALISRKFVDYFEKKMKERIERMTLKCTKSKSALFTTGRAYKVLAAIYDEDAGERVYLLETDRGSTCYTSLRGCQGEFKTEGAHDVQ